MTNNTINVPRELLENIVLCYNEGEFELGTLAAECHALLSTPSPAGVDGLAVSSSGWFSLVMNAAAELETASYSITDPDAKRVAQSGADYYRSKAKSAQVVCLSDAQAIIDGLRVEVARLREDRDSFQRIGIRQIEHRYQLAALLLEKFPRIDPHHPITLSEVDHCCEYVLHKDRERLHCAIDAALSAGKEGE